ncbi:MAG: tetratricopeptide repeat protein [Candidatus Poribacteria bacterium]|nr:tetratricopeptide repeat protein [Candidatus Poribacteria bacterium]
MLTYRLLMCFFLALCFQWWTTSVWSDTDVELNNPFALGLHYMEMEQYDKALAAFNVIRKQEPSSGIYCYIGMVLQEQNRLSEALEAYQNALTFKAPPQIHGSAHLHLGIVYKAQGKLRPAETHLEEALALTPETPEAHIHLGEVYLLQRRLDKAERAYRQSIRLNPNFTQSYYGLGRVAEMQKDYISAIQDFQRAIKQNSYDPQPHYRLAMAYRCLQEQEAAEKAMAQFERMKSYSDNVHRFRETIYKNPNTPILYVKLGELHEKFDNFADAQRVYQTAITLHPTFLPAYHSFGTALIRQRALEEATAVYLKITEIKPDDVQAWLKLGVIYINRQQFEPAIEAFKQAITADDTSGEAYNNLARVYAGLGSETKKAIVLAEKAIALSPIPKHYDTLAYTYFRDGQYPEALVAINRAVTLAPDEAAYGSFRTKIQEKMKKNRK